MSDLKEKLRKKFEEGKGFANFGDYIESIHVKEIRCHKDTIISIKSPITVFCGINGTGKSTILQIAAAAYKSPIPGHTQFSIRDFILKGNLVPAPFQLDAKITFLYAQNNAISKRVCLEYEPFSQRWKNYKNRPARKVLFMGVGAYLPKVERRDYFVRNASLVNVSDSYPVEKRSKDWISKVLATQYTHINLHTLSFAGKKGEAVSVTRGQNRYSESHMGYGEGRTQYMISALERLPEKSLVLIEEPETSLHPSAQHEFARYLMDVCIKKGHQIFLTTHSEFILQALPPSSRIYLARIQDGIACIPGLSAMQATSLMTDGRKKALHILVEDECARAVVMEVLRRSDSNLLASVGIHIGGDRIHIDRTIATLIKTGLSVAAVRDADTGEDRNLKIFKLPGSMPPEKELFGNAAVREHIQRTYSLDLANFETTLIGVNHHEWLHRLSERISQDKTALTMELARVYAHALPEGQVNSLTLQLRNAISR